MKDTGINCHLSFDWVRAIGGFLPEVLELSYNSLVMAWSFLNQDSNDWWRVSVLAVELP